MDNSGAHLLKHYRGDMASLEERIAARLREVLDHQERGGFAAPPDTERGMAIGGPDNPEIVLTVEDVARIAAQVAKMPAMNREKIRKTAEERTAELAALGIVSTPESRAWAKRTLAESRERHAQTDWVQNQREFAEWVRDPVGPPPWGDRRQGDGAEGSSPGDS